MRLVLFFGVLVSVFITVGTIQTQAQNVSPAQVKTVVPTDSLFAPIPNPPTIEVSESYETVYTHQGPTIKLNIPGADPLKVEKSWIKYLKNFKGKTKGTKGEYYTGGAKISGLSDAANLYSKIDGYKDGALLKVQADVGGGTYLNSKTDVAKYAIFRKILLDFAISESVKGLSSLLSQEEKQLMNFDNERTDQKNTESELLEELASLRAAMQRAETQLNENKEAQIRLNYDIKKQINYIEYIKNSLKSVSQQK